MSNTVTVRRSQAILRLPVDEVWATMRLHDGTPAEVMLFVPAGETITQLLTAGDAFLPVVRNRNVSLVARAAIASLAVTAAPPPAAADTDLPVERQRAVIHFRGGGTLEGELRWTAPAGRQRTADHLNDHPPYFELHTDGLVHYVVKAHVAMVDEK